MHDDVGRQLLERLQVMSKRLFDEVAFFHAGRADVLLEQVAGCAGHERRDLGFSRHDLQRILYIFVVSERQPVANLLIFSADAMLYGGASHISLGF